ncbi:BaiN/RdsA family NAD(P)/FAD-dependent oxidoreductase [Granulicatella seriolae]|uniref:NAD(P)/FAD-dependent oxidoreductase n=1 Tax=Granulicatella seriolae TaxID=2967226 RepID=A0ABT1WP77_9LACT|nr:NAD(P)/FAD-dependent oxidoreductase [Granulicatella seriolae]
MTDSYDVIVVGGGTSGLMAAVTAAQNGAKVLLLEKNPSLGKKMLLTGGTRCNVTNARPAEEIIAHIPGNGRFLYSAFSQYNNHDIIDFFQSRGVALKEEDHGRLFPTTDSAKTILEAFIKEIKKLGVSVRTNVQVKKLLVANQQVTGVLLDNGEALTATSVILAMGGKSYPKTGSTGDGYALARSAGHTITPLFATEVPLTSDEAFIADKNLRALSLRDIALSVLNKKGKAVVTHQMDMIFTHFGISGPAVLRCSSFVYQIQQREVTKEVTMHLDLLPNRSLGSLAQEWQAWLKESPQRAVKTFLKEWMPERYAEFLLNRLDLPLQLPINQVTKPQEEALLGLIKGFTFTVNGSLPIEKGFVTGGGVSTKEVDPKTMGSKKVSGLYFCGELLDIHGYTGGYNITAAFVTGHTAGQHAAWTSLKI